MPAYKLSPSDLDKAVVRGRFETVSRLELHLFVVSIRVEDDDADPC